ncbi:hypothetical protein EMCRGX_G010224 [Ephydatia muelleri]
MAITSLSNGCNDLYPLEFAVQLLNGTRDDLLDEVLLKMNLCSTEQDGVACSKPSKCPFKCTSTRVSGAPKFLKTLNYWIGLTYYNGEKLLVPTDDGFNRSVWAFLSLGWRLGIKTCAAARSSSPPESKIIQILSTTCNMHGVLGIKRQPSNLVKFSPWYGQVSFHSQSFVSYFVKVFHLFKKCTFTSVPHGGALRRDKMTSGAAFMLEAVKDKTSAW